MLLEHHYENNNTNIVSLYLSSNIIMSNYNKDTEELLILFKGGTQYKYEKVDLLKYIDFVRDDSQGKYLTKHIKDQHTFTKSDKVTDITLLLEKLDNYKKGLSK